MFQRCILIFFVLSLFFFPACGRVEQLVLEPTATPMAFSQWAIAAEASSQFGYPDWSVNRVTGAPDVGECADDARAWASSRGDGLAWLQLTYAEPVYATEVRIYQTFGRGAVSKVVLMGQDGEAEVIWEGMDVTAPCPGVLAISVPRTPYKVVRVRVELDESRTGFWNQIDAIALVGMP